MKSSIAKRATRLTAAVVALIAMAGCIKNDIPYPRIQANIISLEVADQQQPTLIDSLNRTATVYLTEEADIYNVDIKECRISRGAHFVGDSLYGKVDLSSPKYFKLSIYQDYVWTVKAEQTIERYFTVANQIGQSVIDVPGHRIIVNLPSTADLTRVKVLTAKLGSPNATMTPDIIDAEIDLSRAYQVEVTDYGRQNIWNIYADVTESTVTTTSVDAWSCVAWVYGEAEEGKTNTVEYRRADQTEWTRVPDSWLYSSGGSFYARLIHLESLTDYVARAVSNDEVGNEIEFKTGAILQLPNSDFENWWLDGKVWNPWAEGGTPYWDTGNKGAATLGSSNSVPTDITPTGTGRAALLETRFIGIGMLGKLGAGNIFVGRYVRTEGTNGVVSMGREFTERPTKVRGYFKYHTTPISHVSAGFESYKERPDTGIVWCALIDTPEPFEVRTNPNNRQVLDPDGPYIVAYGCVERGYDVDEYTQFEFELKYKSTSRVPTYILLAASASKLGDYFTGGNGSTMYVDDIELLYDY